MASPETNHILLRAVELSNHISSFHSNSVVTNLQDLINPAAAPALKVQIVESGSAFSEILKTVVSLVAAWWAGRETEKRANRDYQEKRLLAVAQSHDLQEFEAINKLSKLASKANVLAQWYLLELRSADSNPTRFEKRKKKCKELKTDFDEIEAQFTDLLAEQSLILDEQCARDCAAFFMTASSAIAVITVEEMTADEGRGELKKVCSNNIKEIQESHSLANASLRCLKDKLINGRRKPEKPLWLQRILKGLHLKP